MAATYRTFCTTLYGRHITAAQPRKSTGAAPLRGCINIMEDRAPDRRGAER